MSTLRDPNSFGSYLIIILSFALVYLLKIKDRNVKKIMLGIVVLSTLCLWFTFSRSAWIGALLAMLSIAAFYIKEKRKFRINPKLIAVLCVVSVLALAMVYSLRNTYFVKNVIFHADESTVLEDPNELRVRFWQESIEAAVEEPLGYGPGTAGLASIRNEKQGTILNENYYFQILHEAGFLGLLLFLSILFVLALRLYGEIASNPTALALLAALIGLLFTNFLVHIWSNEAVAFTWWGLAGILFYRGNSHNKKAPKN